MIKELSIELGVTEAALTKFFKDGIPNIEIAEQENTVAKMQKSLDAETKLRQDAITAELAKLAAMKSALQNVAVG